MIAACTEKSRLRQMPFLFFLSFLDIMPNALTGLRLYTRRRADKYPYPHDRRADKDSYPQVIKIKTMILCICITLLIVTFSVIIVINFQIVN